MLILPLFLSLMYILSGVDGANDGTLIFVQAIWRHGDRAPSKLPYPNDPHNESAWPRGWSQLTNVGMQQMYDLGQFFRRRYGSFIGESFNVNDISLLSSSSDRAVVSAQAMLRGFFPANQQSMWLQGELWQPIPFSSMTSDQDDPVSRKCWMLRPTDYVCPKYDSAMSSFEQVTEEVDNEYSDVFELLSNVTGFEKVGFHEATSLYNIKREVLHNMSEPFWVFQTWPSHENKTTLEILEEIKQIERISEFNSSEKAKLRGGLLAANWIERALNVSKDVQKKPKKMMLFSAHDGTVLSLMYAMKVGNDLLVPYSACLIMEIYRTNNNETQVKVIIIYSRSH
uniref:Lysosomal acid phosphatase n=1 Tax=Ascaris lumbricoides TaxID=6252 RepID=A0A0M3IHL5_ASCLU